jgi:RNA polymerase sigma factor (sigma-70 family)
MHGASVPQPASTGEGLYLQHRATIERVISFVCGRHRLSRDDADDFAADVRLRLVENDYAILRKYEARSSIGTYLTVVIQRLFLDYRIRGWGKWRPSAQARREGPVGVLLERLLTRDRLGFDEAFRLIAAKHEGQIERRQLENLASRLPVRLSRRFESEGALAEIPSPHGTADVAVVDREYQHVADRIAEVVKRHTSHLATSDQLLLRLRFEDARTIPEIAAVLRVESKPLYRRIERLLAELRGALEAEGVTAQDVQEVLGRRAAIEWRTGAVAHSDVSQAARKGSR